MLQIIYYLLFAMNFLVRNRKKTVRWIILLTGIYVILLWAGNNDGPDINNYLSNYKYFEIKYASNGLYQILYVGVMKVIREMGYTFYEYRIIVSTIALIFAYNVLKKFNINLNYYICLYFPIMLFMDGIQIRNFLATPFLLLAFYFMVEHRRNWKVKYSLALLGAVLIHSSFIVYYIVLFIPDKVSDGKKLIKIHASIGIILTMFLFFYRDALNVVINLMKIIDSTRVTQYSRVQTRFGSLIAILMHVAAIAMSVYSYSIITKKVSVLNNVNGDDVLIVRNILWINLLACYLLPLTLIQINFYRLIRNIIYIDFIMFAVTKKYCKKYSLYSFAVVVFVLAWFVLESMVLSNPSVIIEPFFRNNIYFNAN